MLLVAAIGISIINRTASGVKIVSDMKRGYSAYQGSDREAEELMNQLRALDSETNGQIPENVIAFNSSYCGNDQTQCKLGGAGDFESTATAASVTSPGMDVLKENSVAVITGLRKKVTENGLTRFIEVPTQERIPSGLNETSLKVEKCGGTPTNACASTSPVSYNRCDLKLTLTPSGDTTITGNIKDYEPRRSTSESLGNLTTYGWRPWATPPTRFNSPTPPSQSIILPNGDTIIGGIWAQSGGQYGQEYFFTVKARNKNPFYLDSFYLFKNSEPDKAPVNMELEDVKDCTNDADTQLKSLGCIADGKNPVGTEVSNESYNCCNDTECYEPDPHWKKDPGYDCALQECGYNDGGVQDEVEINPSGTASTGYCRTKSDCRDGIDCTYMYRTVGYCTNPPVASTQSSGFLPSTNWSLSNYIDVYMGGPTYPNPAGIPNYPPGLPRCSKHNCPTYAIDGCVNPVHGDYTVSLSSCSAPTCGPYTASVNCSLSCDSGYVPAESKPSTTAEQVTVSYSKKCCYGICPASPYGTNCGSTANGSYNNVSTCTPRCATSATDVGYDVDKICNLSCDSGYSRDTRTVEDDYPLGKACVLTNITNNCSGSIATNGVLNGPNSDGVLTFVRTWDGNSYEPDSKSVSFSETYGECHFKCPTNYTYNGSTACVANTQSGTCESKPANSVWSNDGNFTQTWDGDSWDPATKSASYSTDTTYGQCYYKCATGFTPSGSDCVEEVVPYCTVEYTKTIWGNSFCGSTVIYNIVSGGYVCLKIDGNTSLYFYNTDTETYDYIANGKHGPYQMLVSYTTYLYDSAHNVLCSGTINVP